jgi:hypothetical protein
MYTKDVRRHNQTLIDVAYALLDRGETKLGNKLLKIGHGIRASTLSGSLPSRETVQALSLFLKDQGIIFAVIGGMACNSYTTPRPTDDLDILVDKLPDQSVLSDREYLGKFGFRPTRSRTGTILILDHAKGGVELLLANTPLRKGALKSQQIHSVRGIDLPVVSPAFLIGLKAVAITDNPKRKLKDSIDIVAINMAQKPDLDKVSELLTPESKISLKTALSKE